MTLINWASRSPSEIRRDTTTYIRDIQTGHMVTTYWEPDTHDEFVRDGWRFDLRQYFKLGWYEKIEVRTIQDGPCEGFEVIYADGEAVAWVDESPHSVSTDEVREAVFPSTQLIAAE